MKFSINGGNVIRLLFLLAKLLKFEIQKCSQILCAHKPYFLMPSHILYSTKYSRDKEFMVFMVTANFPANFMMLGQLRIRNSM